MSGFLYFRPTQTRNVTLDDVQAWGLAYAFERPPLSRQCMANTPTGTAGMLFADPKRHDDGGVKMDMDAQVWRKMPRPGLPEVYVGYWKEAVPEPADLARFKQMPGYRIPLADDNKWLIPVVRYFNETSGELVSNLPCYLDLDEAGRTVNGEPLAEFAHLWEATAPFAEEMLADGEAITESTADQINDCAKTLLQANYVIGWPEIAAARLLTNQQMAHNIVAVAVDWPTYLRWRDIAKKKIPSRATAAG